MKMHSLSKIKDMARERELARNRLSVDSIVHFYSYTRYIRLHTGRSHTDQKKEFIGLALCRMIARLGQTEAD